MRQPPLTWRSVGLLRVKLWGAATTLGLIIGVEIRCDNYHQSLPVQMVPSSHRYTQDTCHQATDLTPLLALD